MDEGSPQLLQKEGPNRVRQTPRFERAKFDKVRCPQVPASGDTNSRDHLQVAGVEVVTAAPLDQEGPGSRSPICGVYESLRESVSDLLREVPRAHLLTWASTLVLEPWAARTRPQYWRVSRSHC